MAETVKEEKKEEETPPTPTEVEEEEEEEEEKEEEEEESKPIRREAKPKKQKARKEEDPWPDLAEIDERLSSLEKTIVGPKAKGQYLPFIVLGLLFAGAAVWRFVIPRIRGNNGPRSETGPVNEHPADTDSSGSWPPA